VGSAHGLVAGFAEADYYAQIDASSDDEATSKTTA
jgi:hypothetical protein